MESANTLTEERLKKLAAIRKLGVAPYGLRFETTGRIETVRDSFAEGRSVVLAGRLMAYRSHGKTTFCDLSDYSARIQLFVKEGVLDKDGTAIFELLDIGDLIGVAGELFKTKTGEQSLRVKNLVLLAKSLKTLPEKWHGLKDVEARFRHRYLDLIANQSSRDIFRKRSSVIRTIRHFLDEKGYLEVETPMMHPIPGGAAGKPFKTHHEALDTDLYLRVAPELYLKKLLVGGFDKVYELNKSFRNEGISTRHNPEFTMLEVYTAFQDVNDVMALTEALIKETARAVWGGLTDAPNDRAVDLSAWNRVSFAELMEREFHIQPEDPVSEWLVKLKKKGVRVDQKDLSRTQLINLVGELIQPAAASDKEVLKPTFVTDYFTELCPLAKTRPSHPSVSERFELYIGGLEIANGYSELNDPQEQRERLQNELREKGKESTFDSLDEDFLLALEHGMPPAGGLGIGVDRLVMILTGQTSIREVILFPQLKPEKPHSNTPG